VESALTRREAECLEWAARGNTTREIAMTLGISQRTVKKYLGGAMMKLDASTRTEAVAKAIGAGLLDGRANSRPQARSKVSR
jgi:DNA-binding CsgD family transcriptional regulator